MNITTIGLDIAKNVFQVHGVDGHGIPFCANVFVGKMSDPFLLRLRPA